MAYGESGGFLSGGLIYNITVTFRIVYMQSDLGNVI